MLKVFRFSIMISLILINFNVKAEEHHQEGLLQLSGALTSSGCGIDNDSAEQTVDFGLLAIRSEKGQYSQRIANSQRKFYIRLTHCDVRKLQINHSQPFDLLFLGAASQYDSRLLAVNGNARGVAIEILDDNGQLIPVGTEVELKDVMIKDNLLAFNASLKGFGSQISAGDINGMAQFTLRYF